MNRFNPLAAFCALTMSVATVVALADPLFDVERAVARVSADPMVVHEKLPVEARGTQACDPTARGRC